MIQLKTGTWVSADHIVMIECSGTAVNVLLTGGELAQVIADTDRHALEYRDELAEKVCVTLS